MSMISGGCHCGAVRFEMLAQTIHNSLCHCSDCRRQSGAPVVAWTMTPLPALKITGTPVVYASSEGGRRMFCGACGTGLFFTNDTLAGMGMIQVRAAALDDPEQQPPAMQVQAAERLSWMENANELPTFERFPK